MVNHQFFDFMVIGNISTEYIVDLNNRAHNGLLAGSALYAAGGIRCWNERIALISKTNENHRLGLQHLHKRYLVDIEGVSFPSNIPESPHFIGYLSPHEVFCGNPVPFYASRKIEFPKGLIGDNLPTGSALPTRSMKYLRQDFPIHYRDITAALVCKSDLPTQLQLTSLLQKGPTKILVIQASDEYMHKDQYENMPVLLKDITAFFANEYQLASLFQNRSRDKWEMITILAGLGCEHVLIEDANFGYYLFDRHSGKRIHVPAYPASINDPTGHQESFCGGFMAGIKRNFDPVEALLCGTVSASFTTEGSGPFYCADAYPSLIQSRFNFARKLVKVL